MWHVQVWYQNTRDNYYFICVHHLDFCTKHKLQSRKLVCSKIYSNILLLIMLICLHVIIYVYPLFFTSGFSCVSHNPKEQVCVMHETSVFSIIMLSSNHCYFLMCESPFVHKTFDYQAVELCTLSERWTLCL